MNRIYSLRRAAAPLLVAIMACALISPASAFPWSRKDETPQVADFAKNGLIGTSISFAQEDFQSKGRGELTGITIESLPDAGVGTLSIAGQPVEAGTVVSADALSGLRFQIAQHPTASTTAFTFLPAFRTGAQEGATTVTLYLLTQENTAPVARNMELTTYKNVAITGYFDAVDGDGDVLTFQLTSTPARGAVTLAEDGSSQFVYTPYENKTGGDSFTYVAIDPAGNTSPEAKVTLRIEKPDTKVSYADLEGHPAQKAAIHLAEEGVYVGRYVNGRYFFDPDQSVSRAQFLTMAMAATGMEELEGVQMTGFTDDGDIPAWAKGSVSAALKAGAVRGSRNEDGAPVFGAEQSITRAEAAVMLNNLLSISDVPAAVFSPGEDHWAAQAAANLAASGVIHTGSAVRLADPLTLSEAAELLDGAIDVIDARERGWLPW